MAVRAGNGTTAARCGKAAVLCGNAIASTKCSWKRGSTAVSIFSTRRTTPSISVRAAPDSRAISAPVPAALPAERTWARSQSGISPRIIAWSGSIWLPKAPASRISSTRVDLELVHQQPDAGVQRGLAELDRPDVVLGDRDPRAGAGPVALVEDVAERPAVGDDARRARGEVAVDDAVLGDDPGQEHLGDDLDDARAADAGDAGVGDAGREGRLVRPGVDADDPEARLERLAVDPDALDGARAPPAGRREIWAPSKAGPVGLEAASSRRLSPRTISAFVPTSTTSVIRSAWCGCSARITPAVSAPTWPAMQGRT